MMDTAASSEMMVHISLNTVTSQKMVTLRLKLVSCPHGQLVIRMLLFHP